jgi:pimeloyl-ACP methyl ester carboxylesterase
MITDMTMTDVENTDDEPANTEIKRANFRDLEVPVAAAKSNGLVGLDFRHAEGWSETAQPEGAPVWFGPAEQPLRGWLHQPLVGNPLNSRRIVIVPGFGYEELTAGWGLRVLAEELAHAGHTVLRYDHPGTGDSSGESPTIDAWFAGMHHAVSALNFPDVTLIGVRLGATLALAAAANFANTSPKRAKQSPGGAATIDNNTTDQSQQGVAFGNGSITQIIAVSPVVSGRRMLRELTMLAATKKAVSSESVGDFVAAPLDLSWADPITKRSSNTTSNQSSSTTSSATLGNPSGTTLNSPVESGPLVVGGFAYATELRAGLSGLDLLSLAASPAPRVEIVHASERSTDKNFLAHLRTLGTAVYESHVDGVAKWLDTSSELATAPQALIDLLKGQLQGDSMVDAHELADESKVGRSFAPAAVIRENQKILSERAFRIGEAQLSAVLTEPVEKPSIATIGILLLNSGVERNIGPGRAWVCWSRSLAAKGHTVLRLDLSGVGNSGTWPQKPAFHSYGAETFDDVALGIAELRALGHQKIVIAGLCASAFSALGMPPHPSVVGIVSLSPQLYRCGTPGSIAEAEDTNFNRHRISQLDQKLNLRRKGAAIEELVGKRHLSTTWIDGWIAQGTHIRLVFGPEDRGLRFLQWRTPRSLKRLAKTDKFALQIHPNLDHALHEISARDEVFRNFCELLETLT